jgi:hypothetical protein
MTNQVPPPQPTSPPPGGKPEYKPEYIPIERTTIPEKFKLLLVLVPALVLYCFVLTTLLLTITDKAQLWAIFIVSILMSFSALHTACEQISCRKDFRLKYGDLIPVVDVRIRFWKTTFSFTFLYLVSILLSCISALFFGVWLKGQVPGWSDNDIKWFQLVGAGFAFVLIGGLLIPVGKPSPRWLYQRLQYPDLYRIQYQDRLSNYYQNLSSLKGKDSL